MTTFYLLIMRHIILVFALPLSWTAVGAASFSSPGDITSSCSNRAISGARESRTNNWIFTSSLSSAYTLDETSNLMKGSRVGDMVVATFSSGYHPQDCLCASLLTLCVQALVRSCASPPRLPSRLGHPTLVPSPRPSRDVGGYHSPPPPS